MFSAVLHSFSVLGEVYVVTFIMGKYFLVGLVGIAVVYDGDAACGACGAALTRLLRVAVVAGALEVVLVKLHTIIVSFVVFVGPTTEFLVRHTIATSHALHELHAFAQVVERDDDADEKKEQDDEKESGNEMHRL